MAGIVEQHNLGKAIAEVYILAQEGVSQEASNTICDLIEKMDPWVKRGFNEHMKTSPYKVRVDT